MPLRSADARFDRLADFIFKSLVELNPTQATWLGIHGANDQILPDRSESAAVRELGLIQEFVAELASFREKDLSVDRVVDLRLAKGGLSTRMYLLQKRPAWKKCPKSYVDDIVHGIYSLMVRDFAPVPKRARAMLGRLKAAPNHLAQAERNLENPSPIFAESAAVSVRGVLQFLETGLIDFIDSLEDPKLARSLKIASEKLHHEMFRFGEWLEGTLLPKSTDEFAIGRTLYEKLLVEAHGLRWSSEQLISTGQSVYQETLREMKKVASRLDPTRPWSKVVEELKCDHPDSAEILSTYEAEMVRARRFVEQNGLVSYPEGAVLEVVATPEFARPIFPFAAYLPPAPFEEAQKGFLWVTTVDPTVDALHRESLLRGHATAGIAVTALHEAIPGHHLQFSRANQRTDRKLRFLFPSSSFIEGWALYCEDMMYQHGFFSEDRARLLQLKDLLWRACRVIIDVELQTGRMGFNEAVSFLVRKAHIERQNAVAEVRRYCSAPTQPMSYVAGKVLIEELLSDYREQKGKQFELRKFHDELLSHGAIPIELIRLEMGVARRRPRGRRRRRKLETNDAELVSAD